MSYRFKLDEIEKAHDIFSEAAKEQTLKILLALK